jgi:hypothetical protein
LGCGYGCGEGGGSNSLTTINNQKQNTIMSIKTTIETITPDIAAQYLLTNLVNQRNVTKTHQLHLRQQMENGQWMLTGQPIIFDDKGRLIDGQHRLRALIDADVSLQFVVTRGVSSDSFIAIDRGKTRTHGNMFAIHGCKNYNIAASCVAGVINYRRALRVEKTRNDKKIIGGSLNSPIRPCSMDMITEYKKHETKYDQAITIAERLKAICPPSASSTAAAMALIDAGHSFEYVEDFWSKVKHGSDLKTGNPILTLRNRLSVCAGSSNSKIRSHYVLMIAVKAWNLHVEGKPVLILRVSEGEPVKAVL